MGLSKNGFTLVEVIISLKDFNGHQDMEPLNKNNIIANMPTLYFPNQSFPKTNNIINNPTNPAADNIFIDHTSGKPNLSHPPTAA